MQNFKLKHQFWENFRTNGIEILNTLIGSVGNLRLSVEIPSEILSVCRKTATLFPACFLTHDVAHFRNI